MKTKTLFISLILLIIVSSFSLSGQGTAFNGEWKINKEKTVLADGQLFLANIKLQIKNDTLFTTRTYQNDMGEEYPFDENLSLDGKEIKIFIYDMPRTSKASRSESDGSFNIESTTTFNGQYGEDNLVAKEKWMIDKAGKVLTIDFTNKMSDVETKGINYYDKL